MKTLCAAAGAALLACNLACPAQTEVACGRPLDAPLQSRAVLTIDSRSASLEIVGTDQDNIHVTCTAGDSDGAQNLRIRLSGTDGNRTLTITGRHAVHNNLQIRIEVPRQTSLRIHMPAGEVKVEEIAGNKDIDLYAGQITISSTRAWDYRSVSASVDVGEVNARVYGADKGGFFRNFTRHTLDGDYQLHAHVVTGEIDLLGEKARTSSD